MRWRESMPAKRRSAQRISLQPAMVTPKTDFGWHRAPREVVLRFARD
jgi:hypothetical protein